MITQAIAEVAEDVNACPRCQSPDVEHVAGDFLTGVVAPDGYRETQWQECFECQKCGLRFEAEQAAYRRVDVGEG